ncbi:hypothetical protein [Nonomuraea salmonea]|uniref:hypothetical protein n=1 Tax=Nonomuraea salmonea TaxID=46181 RepID=UPI002FE876A9
MDRRRWDTALGHRRPLHRGVRRDGDVARREEELEGSAAYRAVIRLLSVIAEPSFLVRLIVT